MIILIMIINLRKNVNYLENMWLVLKSMIAFKVFMSKRFLSGFMINLTLENNLPTLTCVAGTHRATWEIVNNSGNFSEDSDHHLIMSVDLERRLCFRKICIDSKRLHLDIHEGEPTDLASSNFRYLSTSSELSERLASKLFSRIDIELLDIDRIWK